MSPPSDDLIEIFRVLDVSVKCHHQRVTLDTFKIFKKCRFSLYFEVYSFIYDKLLCKQSTYIEIMDVR